MKLAHCVRKDLSVLNVTAGIDVLKQDLQELRKQESVIVTEIKKIRMCQEDQLVGCEPSSILLPRY